MWQFAGYLVMAVAILAAVAYGGFELWKRGKLARLTILPKPPTQETPKP